MIALFHRSEDRALLVSVLAAVEVRSAVRRRERDGDLDATDATSVIAALLQETGRIIESPITPPVLAQAAGIIDRNTLRAADAIQLGCAMVAREAIAIGDELRFVASDLRLLNAAANEGFDTWNPEIPNT
jgi:predicted nucleic acid-binding protein